VRGQARLLCELCEKMEAKQVVFIVVHGMESKTRAALDPNI
jgi:hypothetical protein